MQRQSAPSDPTLLLRPLSPPTAVAIPPHVRTLRGGLEILEAPAPSGPPSASPTAPAAPPPGAGAALRHCAAHPAYDDSCHDCYDLQYGRAAALAPAIAPAPAVLPWPGVVPTFTYLAGAAGSGKTFTTRAWAEHETKGALLLCATTGIAAINLGGETINSVLGYFDTTSLQEQYLNGFLTARLGKLWKAGVRRLVLDEVSMLAGDQLTYLVKAIEEVNGRGYVLGKWTDDDEAPPPAMGLTLVGDFLQLSPVKATYAFESAEWERFTPNVHTLTEIRRQDDTEFIEMLRNARAGHGEWVAEYFAAHNGIQQETDDHYDGPTIVAKNEAVDRYNYLRMSALPGKEVRFLSSRWGKLRSEWGTLEKPPHTWGIPQELVLKIGALVMILANQRDEARRLIYVNGDLGTIVDADETTAWIELQRTSETVRVVPVSRQVKVPADAPRRKELREKGEGDKVDGKWEIIGEITYLPLRVAYASTTHKSQGLSLDRVQVNIRDPFFRSPGMLYVALSRARSAAGLRLVGSPRALVERCVTDPRLKAWL